MKKIVAIMMIMALVLSLGTLALAEGETYKIGCLVWKFNDTFGSSVRNAMEKYCAELGEANGITIEWNAVDANDVMATQIEQAPTIFAQSDLVIINLADVSAGEALIEIASEYPDVPFFFYNKQPSADTEQAVLVEPDTMFVGTLARQAGDMQGEILADLYAADPSIDTNGDGILQYVVFMGEPANDEAQARSKYCVETAEACGLTLEPVVDTIVANWDTAQAQEAMTAAWAANGDKIEVVFCNNDDMAIGVIAALNEAGYNTGIEGDPEIVVIGVDRTDTALEYIKNGMLTATVQQDADAMAKANIQIAINKLLGKDWLEGTGYEFTTEDAFKCIRIPYAKITEA